MYNIHIYTYIHTHIHTNTCPSENSEGCMKIKLTFFNWSTVLLYNLSGRDNNMTFTECIMNLSSLINWMCVNQLWRTACLLYTTNTQQIKLLWKHFLNRPDWSSSWSERLNQGSPQRLITVSLWLASVFRTIL